MTTEAKRNKISSKGKMVCIGIDMHKHSWRIGLHKSSELHVA